MRENKILLLFNFYYNLEQVKKKLYDTTENYC